MSGASAVHMNIFGAASGGDVRHEEQKQRFLPPLIAGKEKAASPSRSQHRPRHHAVKTGAVRHGNG